MVAPRETTGLRAAVGLVAALGACGPRPSPIIGFAYWRASPNVVDVVREELQRERGARAAEIRIEQDLRELGPARDVELATRFAAVRHVVGVVGHQDSRGSLLASPIYAEARIPLVIPTGTSRRLRTASPWTFMLAPDDSAEGAFIAEFAVGVLAARSVAILYDNDEYGRGLRDGVQAALATHGLRPAREAPIGAVCETGTSPLGGEASIALVTPRRAPPQVVVIAGRTRDAACIGRQLGGRVPGVQMIGGDGIEIDTAFVREVGAAADSVYVVVFWYAGLADERSAAFTRAYERLVGRPPTSSEAMQYDAFMLLAQAIHDVGTSREAIRAYLGDLGASRPAYSGITGPIAFGPDRRRPMYMLRLRRGALVASTAP